MHEVKTAETVKKLMQPFLDAGFAFEYTHQKGGDSSCVYIFRFKKGKDYFDWREVSGADELHLVVYARGEFCFPEVKKVDKKTVRAFAFRHIFKKLISKMPSTPLTMATMLVDTKVISGTNCMA